MLERLKIFGQNLINRSTFTLCRETGTQQSSDGWSYVNLTDGSFCQEVFFDAGAGSHKDWRYGCFKVSQRGGQAVAVQTVEAFCQEVNNSVISCILILNTDSETALSGRTVIAQGAGRAYNGM